LVQQAQQVPVQPVRQVRLAQRVPSD
jgi:hypothetical protein